MDQLRLQALFVNENYKNLYNCLKIIQTIDLQHISFFVGFKNYINNLVAQLTISIWSRNGTLLQFELKDEIRD